MNTIEILDFWFADSRNTADNFLNCQKRWFTQNPEFDQEIKKRFGELPDKIGREEINPKIKDPYVLLAKILVLDQFPRNIYRDLPKAFAYDKTALEISKHLIKKNLLKNLHPIEQLFVLLPFEHSEDISDQIVSLKLHKDLLTKYSGIHSQFFQEIYDFAKDHYNIIKRFGRFPHRNTLLERESTIKEKEFLEKGGQTFGTNTASN